jgi:hypothetical protein
LESDQARPHPRTEHSIDRAVIEALLLQDDLHLPDLCRAQVERHCRSAAATLRPGRRLRTRRTDRHDRDDLVAAIDDDNVVTHHEEGVSAPFGMDLDQRGRHFDDAHAGRNDGADAEREVDAVNTRHVAAGQDGLLDLGALLGGQVSSAGTLALLRLALLALSSLTLLSRGSLLTLLGLSSLTLLSRRSPLALLTLRGLSLLRRTLVTLVSRLIAIALTTLGLALLALITLTLLVLTLVLLTLAGVLFALARALLALALLALVLLTLATLGLALLALILLALAGGLIALAVATLFRRLVALVARRLLRLTAAVLLTVLTGAALRSLALCGAAGLCAARLAATRHALG